MRIGELSKATGVDIETIRFYEREGLLQASKREANGYRRYQQDHLQRLAFIRHCRALDMPLQDVRQLLTFKTTPFADCGDINRLIEKQLTNVRTRLAALHALEEQLSVLRTQCGQPLQVEKCGILQELDAAAQGDACVCHGE
jgi:Cd(II)/Pb(II)-responsive transcriptional regulator